MDETLSRRIAEKEEDCRETLSSPSIAHTPSLPLTIHFPLAQLPFPMASLHPPPPPTLDPRAEAPTEWRRCDRGASPTATARLVFEELQWADTTSCLDFVDASGME